MTAKCRLKSSFATVLTSLLVGCTGTETDPQQDPSPPENVATQSAEAIINGDTVIPGTLEALGPVRIIMCPAGLGCGALEDSSCYGCSGTLVTNQQVYTAKHCTTYDPPPSFTTKAPTADFCVKFESFTEGTDGGSATQKIGVTKIDWDPGVFAANDQAILTLSVPARSAGTSNSMSHRVTSSVANGSVVSCLGYGLTVEADAGSYGNLRTASLVVNQTLGMTEVLANSRGQYAASGDSGSTCFPGSAAPTSISKIMGVFSYGLLTDDYYTPTHTSNNTSKPFVDGLVLAPAAVKFSFVPSMSGTVPGTVSVVDDSQSVSLSDSVTTTLSSFAPRSTWVSATADATSAGYACPPISLEHAPLTGTANLSTTCLSHALLSVLMN